MANIYQLMEYLNKLLQPELFQDYCPNGLQVAGRTEILRLVTGVTASQALLNQAEHFNADVILVHHGYFWHGEDPCIVGIKRARLATLMKHDVNLIAYHLPLDAHDHFGNNIQLAKILNFITDGNFIDDNKVALGRFGHLEVPMTGVQFTKHVKKHLRREPLYIAGNSPVIRSIAWCTGAAQDYISEAARVGVDAYLTGEVSERTVHFAREAGIHFFAAGHHATERYGVMALGEHLAEQFNLKHRFIDVDNPV